MLHVNKMLLNAIKVNNNEYMDEKRRVVDFSQRCPDRAAQNLVG